MNRKEFDNLEVINQIKYINERLNNNDTLTNICKEIGIGRTTVRDRFKGLSYEYNKETKKYESFIEVIETTNELKSSKKVVGAIEDNNAVLEHILINYSNMNNKLNEMYDWYKLQSSEKVVEGKKLIIDDFEGKVVTRSYKLYEPIQKEFAEFCKRNKFKVQDLLSQALTEFLNKYK